MAHIRSEYIKNLIEDKNQLNESLKETTKETLKAIVDEAVNKNLRKMISESEDEGYTEEEVDDEADNVKDDEVKDEEVKDDKGLLTDNEEDSEEEKTDEKDGEEEDVWSSLEQYKDSDGEYDLTGMDVEDTIKVLKNMSPEDGVRVVSTGDGYKLTDEENDVEYIFDDDDIEPEGEAEFEADVDEPEDDEEAEIELEFGDDDIEDIEDIDDVEDEDSIELELDDEDDVDECDLHEGQVDLGYTDDYQKDTAMTTPSNEEPSSGYKNSKNDWDKGAPHGTEKRFSSLKAKQTPYEDTVNEGSSKANGSRTMKYNNTEPGKPTDVRHRGHGIPKKLAKNSTDTTEESILRKANAVFNENKQLKQIAEKIKTRLSEACVINASLGKIIKLVTENSTTRDEKIDIVERFNAVKDVNEANALYETISQELRKAHKINNVGNTINGQLSESKKHDIIETAMYESKDLSDTLSLMERLNRIK